MASPALCLFCFEALDSSFEGTESSRLKKVEELWDAYQLALKQATGEDAMETDNMEDDDSVDNEDDSELEQASAAVSQATAPPSTATLQPPSISRLRSSAARSSDSSSATSTTSLFTNQSSTSSTTSYSSALQTALSDESYPVFVTWNTVSARTGSKHLRGCIGTFEPLPLAQGLEQYARTSAFDDHRFNPIPASLLPQVSCSITLLADFTTCDGPLDWDLGTHGIRISFLDKSGTRRYGSTYLPDVAVEQGWTKGETIESLMRKAGWDGSTVSASTVGVARRLLRGGRSSSGASVEIDNEGLNPWDRVLDFKTVRYTGLKATASYSEWREWRAWVEENGLTKSLKSG